MIIEVTKIVCTVVFSSLATLIFSYVSFIHGLRIKVAEMEQRIKHLDAEIERVDSRVDSHSKKLDDIIEGVNEIKITMAKISTVLSIVEKSNGYE